MICVSFVYLRRSPPHGLEIRFPSRYKSTTLIIPVRLRYYKPRSNVFYRSGPCVRSRGSQTNITPRVESRSMYLSVRLTIPYIIRLIPCFADEFVGGSTWVNSGANSPGLGGGARSGTPSRKLS